ncbi:MAG: hypothetical protein AAGG11_07610 [Pseudomonadota bacterium]
MLSRALADGARLFILDFQRVPGVSRDWMLNHVRAGKETVIAEVEQGGFELVAELEIPGLEENYLFEFRRCKG